VAHIRQEKVEQLDLNKLSTGDKVIGISGIVLLVFSFFKWLGVKASGRGVASGLVSASESKSAWGFTLTLIAVLIGIAMVAVVVIKAMGTELPKLGAITWNQVLLGAALVAFVFIVIKLIAGPADVTTGTFGSVEISKKRDFGIFVGLLASIGLVAGAYLNAAAAGELPGGLGGKGGKGGATPPPAA